MTAVSANNLGLPNNMQPVEDPSHPTREFTASSMKAHVRPLSTDMGNLMKKKPVDVPRLQGTARAELLGQQHLRLADNERLTGGYARGHYPIAVFLT